MQYDQYFASLPTEECGKACDGKVEDYYRNIETTGYFELIRKTYSAYYGSSSNDTSTGRLFQSTNIRRGGIQGELYDFKVNDLRNLLQHLLTMTTSEKPEMEAVAVNTDHESLLQAKLGSGLLEYYMVEKRMERVLVDAAELGLVTAGGHVGVFWNTGTGNKYATIGGQVVYNGDLDFRVFTPMDVVIDTYAKSRHTLWKILRTYENKWNLVAQIPELKDEILKVQTSDKEISQYSLSKTGGGMESDEIPTFHLYHEKCPALPDGRMLSFLPGGKVFFDGPLPYKKVPIFTLMPATMHGTPYGYSPAFDLLAIQEAEDLLYSAALTNQAAFGVQNLWLPKGHDVRIQSLAGGLKVIETDPRVGKPESLNLTHTPPELFNFMAGLDAKMEKIAGLNSIVRGQPQGQLSGASGAAMALLASQAIQFSHGLQREYEFLVEDVGTACLQTLQQYANTERLALIAGKANKSYLRAFSSKDIDRLDRAVVKRTSAISRSTAGKVDIAKSLLDAGLVKTPEQYVTVMTTGRLEPVYEGDQAELMLIRAENEKLRSGEPGVVAVATDKHPTHIEEHRCVMADPDTRSNPALIAATLAHINEHINLLRTTDPALLAMLGMQSLAGAPMAPGAVPPEAGGTMTTADVAAEGQMPSLPNMPTNPLTGEQYQSPVEEANNPGELAQ